MLAKLTSKNQLTLPKTVVQSVGTPEYFDVELRDGQIVLTPLRIQRGDAVRAKLAALGLSAVDVGAAVQWARAGGTALQVQEPVVPYGKTQASAGISPQNRTGRSAAGKPAARKSASRR
jgi:hypothetical protein